MHPFLSAEEVKERNRKICARAASQPKPTNVALSGEFGVSRETIRRVLSAEGFRLRRIAHNEKIAAKFRGVFTEGQPADEKPAG
jgi:hypothetical protein